MFVIESLIKRKVRTPIDIDGVQYFFEPLDSDPSGPHLCEVEDEDHAARFLSIREGYRLARQTEARRAESTPAKNDGDTGQAKRDMSAQNAARMAKRTAPVKPLDAKSKQPEPIEQQPILDTDSLSDGALATRYEEAFGGMPPKDMTREDLLAALVAVPK